MALSSTAQRTWWLESTWTGCKHVLGVWLGEGGEGAKYWLSVLTEIRNRGLEDVLIVCCDGLKGLPDAIEATWPQALVQTCVIHLLRASMRLCSWKDRKAIVAGLRRVYTAVNAEAAGKALDELEEQWGNRYPGVNGPISSKAAAPRRPKHNQQTRRKPRHRHPRLENSPKPTRNPLP